jgi:hypothetical protein
MREGVGVLPPPPPPSSTFPSSTNNTDQTPTKSKSKSNKNKKDKEEIDYVQALNSALPEDIRVVSWCPVPLHFNARYHPTYPLTLNTRIHTHTLSLSLILIFDLFSFFSPNKILDEICFSAIYWFVCLNGICSQIFSFISNIQIFLFQRRSRH